MKKDEIIATTLKNNLSMVLEILDDENSDLRRAAATVAAQYYSNAQPGIEKLTFFIAWLEKHLNGIPFVEEYVPEKHGDYDPRRPAHFLGGMYQLLESYQQDGNAGTSRLLTTPKLQKLYAEDFFKHTAEKIKETLLSPALTPSAALALLSENWELYSTPSFFRNINKCIEFCIYCATDFPDSDDARTELAGIIRTLRGAE